MVVEQERVGYEDGPNERDKMEARVRASQQRSDAGHLHSNIGGRGDRLDTDCDATPASEGKCNNKPHEDDETTDAQGTKGVAFLARSRESGAPWYLSPRRPARSWSWKSKETAKRWLIGSTVTQSKKNTNQHYCGSETNEGLWGRGTDLGRRVAEWQVLICREHKKEAGAWAGTGARGREEEWVDIANVVWSEVTGMGVANMAFAVLVC